MDPLDYDVPATVGPPRRWGLHTPSDGKSNSCSRPGSGLHLASPTSTTKHSTLCYLYGRLRLTALTFALCPSLRAVVWQQQQREVSLLKLVRHLQAGADQRLQALFQSGVAAHWLLPRAWAVAQCLAPKEVRNRPPSAGTATQELGAHVDFLKPNRHLQPN